VHALLASLLVVVSVATTGWTAVATIILVGLLNSVMFPTIFTIAIEGLGRHTGQGSGILCTAIVGGAFIPALQGVLADKIGLHLSFLLPAVCYLYIAWYGLKGPASAHRAA
jgi:FHS family L-fucose permease-like MFS transporter